MLKPNGRIRISTPDLRFLIDLYNHPHNDYIRWVTDKDIPWAPIANRTFVINNFVRDWGHQFIYDEPTLGAALARGGLRQYCSTEAPRATLRLCAGSKRDPNAAGFFIAGNVGA